MGVLAAAIFAALGYRPAWLFADWNSTAALPFPVRDRLEIATRWRPLKSQSISLVCGPNGVHVMAKGRLALPEPVRRNLASGTADASSYTTSIIVSWYGKQGKMAEPALETRSTLVAVGETDTFVTAVLASGELKRLTESLARGTDTAIFASIGEEALIANAVSVDDASLNRFLQSCSVPDPNGNSPQ